MAVAHLISAGYQVLERNWRAGHLEIDIIAKTGETLVIVEVKSRKNNTFGEPEIFVNKRKQGFLIKAANHYVLEKNLELEVRFDIVAVTDTNILHLERAFFPLAR